MLQKEATCETPVLWEQQACPLQQMLGWFHLCTPLTQGKNIAQVLPAIPPPARDPPWEIPSQEEFGGAPLPGKEGRKDSAEQGAGRDSKMTQDDGGALRAPVSASPPAKIRAQEFTGGSRREMLGGTVPCAAEQSQAQITHYSHV